MTNRSPLIGILLMILISCIPIILLFAAGPKVQISSSDMTHKAGQIAGLVGVTLFAIAFVLSTRARIIERIFGGLDKVYMVHGIIGSIALTLLLAHPILLVLKFIPQDIALAALYLLPTAWSVAFGTIALLGLATLIGITIYSKLRYDRWKFSHEFLGLVFISAVLHIFLIRNNGANDYIFHGYYIFAGIVSAIGLLAFIYVLFFRNNASSHAEYTIKDIRNHNNVTEITLIPKQEGLRYRAGQFAFISFHRLPEPHPFSIASESDSKEMRFYIKSLGDYTARLKDLKAGEKTVVEGPYGRFLYDDSKDQIWIAGGIGITPFIGMAQDLGKDMRHNVTLYYSVNTEDELIRKDLFHKTEKENGKFRFKPWITKKQGYLDVRSINEGTKNKRFYICGPAAMKDSLISGLVASGVNKADIFAEDFNFR